MDFIIAIFEFIAGVFGHSLPMFFVGVAILFTPLSFIVGVPVILFGLGLKIAGR